MPEPEVFILARLIEQVEAPEPIPVTPHPCNDCGRTCGISPSSVEAIKEHGWLVRCFDCRDKMSPGPTIYTALPEAINEMRINNLARDVKSRQN